MRLVSRRGVLEVDLGDALDERRDGSRSVSVLVGLGQAFVERGRPRLCWDELGRRETSTGIEGGRREATFLKDQPQISVM